MGNIEKIRSEGKIPQIHKGIIQRKQDMCTSGGGDDRRVYGRIGSATGVALIPVIVV